MTIVEGRQRNGATMVDGRRRGQHFSVITPYAFTAAKQDVLPLPLWLTTLYRIREIWNSFGIGITGSLYVRHATMLKRLQRTAASVVSVKVNHQRRVGWMEYRVIVNITGTSERSMTWLTAI